MNYTKNSTTGRNLRIQVLRIPAGACISNAVEITDNAPADLRGYQGGWDLYPRTYKNQKAACARLEKDGWVKEQ